MVNELSLNQTVQGEVGEFNTLEAGDVTLDTLSVTGDVTFDSDVTIEGELTVNDDVTIDGSCTISQWLRVSRYIESKQAIYATDCISGRWTQGGTVFVEDYSLDDIGAKTNDLKSRCHIITNNDQVLARNVYLGEWNVADSEDTSDFSIDYNLRTVLDGLTRSISALEAASNPSSGVDDLSTTVQALQTRIGTLESLIGLLTNNNTNDTAIEHRISRIEKAITALKAIHDSKKSIYSIPLDW